jgi:Leucine-rich repeat (LRR) protein
MESSLNHIPASNQSGSAVGQFSNGGTRRYLIEAESSTGFIAWKLADGITLTSNSIQVSLPAGPLISFWACAAYTDSTPAGQITSLDCHGNEMTHLEICTLKGLKSLDCSFNSLAELSLGELPELQVLDASNNQLTNLNVRGLGALRVLDCSYNRLTQLDVSNLDALQILEHSKNTGIKIKTGDCPLLEAKRKGRMQPPQQKQG